MIFVLMTQDTCIRVPKKVADLLYIYCKLNNIAVKDYLEQILSKKLESFEKDLRKSGVMPNED